MQYYFDPDTLGFYSDELHGARELPAEQTDAEIKAGKRPRMVANPDTGIPVSAVEVTANRYQKLMAEQAEGKRIVARAGKPVAVDHEPDAEEQRELRRRQRDQRLSASDWTQLSDSPLSAAEKAEWVAYRQLLRDLDMNGTEWPAAPGEGEA